MISHISFFVKKKEVENSRLPLVFIEVKTRTTLNYGHPFESITQSKIQKIYKGILGYLNQIDKKYKSYRFDGIAIIGLENPSIEHIKDLGQF